MVVEHFLKTSVDMSAMMYAVAHHSLSILGIAKSSKNRETKRGEMIALELFKNKNSRKEKQI